MEKEGKKCACGLPLDEKTICSCNSDLCVYCCECAPDCQCSCQQKR